MDTDPHNQTEEPANIRFLRRLVTVLTATMILGLLVLITLIVIRLQAPSIILPDQVSLPEGVTATAYTQGQGWFAVVTDDERILIYDGQSGALRQEIGLE